MLYFRANFLHLFFTGIKILRLLDQLSGMPYCVHEIEVENVAERN